MNEFINKLSYRNNWFYETEMKFWLKGSLEFPYQCTFVFLFALIARVSLVVSGPIVNRIEKKNESNTINNYSLFETFIIKQL